MYKNQIYNKRTTHSDWTGQSIPFTIQSSSVAGWLLIWPEQCHNLHNDCKNKNIKDISKESKHYLCPRQCFTDVLKYEFLHMHHTIESINIITWNRIKYNKSEYESNYNTLPLKKCYYPCWYLSINLSAYYSCASNNMILITLIISKIQTNKTVIHTITTYHVT